MFPIFFEGGEMFADVTILIGSSVPEISNDGDSGLLAFILIDSLEVTPGCVRRRAMLNMNQRFVGNILSN